jgi:hypothetical protein
MVWMRNRVERLLLGSSGKHGINKPTGGDDITSVPRGSTGRAYILARLDRAMEKDGAHPEADWAGLDFMTGVIISDRAGFNFATRVANPETLPNNLTGGQYRRIGFYYRGSKSRIGPRRAKASHTNRFRLLLPW